MKQHVTVEQLKELNWSADQLYKFIHLEEPKEFYNKLNEFYKNPVTGLSYEKWSEKYVKSRKEKFLYDAQFKMTIGKMIEMLKKEVHKSNGVTYFLVVETIYINYEICWSVSITHRNKYNDHGYRFKKENLELCDALWEAVKEIL